MKAQVANTIRKFGEPVEVIYRDGSPTAYVSASVQRPTTENLVNDFDTFNFVVYIARDDLTVVPQKFDRIRLRGELRAVEDVHVETLKGVELCFMIRVRG